MDSGRDSPNSSAHRESKKNKAALEAQAPVNGGIPCLPEEIVVEILARLPVKSLLKFRCVSKSWLALIYSQQLIKTHLNNSRSGRNFSNYRIMSTISHPNFDLRHCSVISLMQEPSTDACSIDYPKKHPKKAVWVVGSCNGLICLAINEKDLFFWNPSTRKSKKLPPVNVNIKRGFYNIYGFGYNECDDDYKVVGIFCVFGNAGAYESMVKIYSSKINSWKRMEDFKGGVPLDDSGKFACGKLHWSASSNLGLDFRWDIVSLDMESEVYGIVEQPNYGEREFDSTLGVLGECICILCNYQYINADLWVLKEYGVKESWTKVATIPYVDTPGKLLYSKVLFMLQNGELLLVFGMHFVVYNPEDNSVRIPETSNLKAFLEADIYFESLVSPLANER
ncbi:F-box/kelch-repeat protein At3g23880-like isoform X1 [Primulina huaijiensis]|uniref:F-box/kelch-repeat protein At3g23880-like isoform X1 n=1 Tax=Primulina huaijiensis TaxID=1492673 RepID=UPI003CC73920